MSAEKKVMDIITGFEITMAVFFAFGCGGSTLPEPIDASPDVPSESTVEDSPGVTQKDGEKCGWKCQPVDGGTEFYVDTCTNAVCPGTGNCASHFVPNVCADGGQ